MSQIDLRQEPRQEPKQDKKSRPKNPSRVAAREMIDEDEEWCSINNPAIWVGDEDDSVD